MITALEKTVSVVTGLRAWALAGALLALGCQGEQGERGPLGPEGPPGSPASLGDTTLDKALFAIGGRVALTAMQRFEVVATGARNVIGEGFAAGDPSVEFTAFTATVSVDLAEDLMRIHYVRDLSFGPVTRLDYNEIIRGNVGFVAGRDSILEASGTSEVMHTARMATSRRQQRLLNPHLILREILADPTIAHEAGAAFFDGSIHELLVVDDPITPITLWVNTNTGFISKLTLVENDPLTRDSEIEVHYAGWKVLDKDVAFPRDVFVVKDGQLLHRERRESVVVDPSLDPALFDFPSNTNPVFVADEATFANQSHAYYQMFVGIGLPLDLVQKAPSDVGSTMLAPGVFHVHGSTAMNGSHNSLVIAQATGVVVVEAPLHPERSEAILQFIANNAAITNKTVTHVIMTHHHVDHSAGLRAFVAAGAKVVMQENSRAFFEKVFKAPSTVLPDRQAMTPMNPIFSTIAENGTLTIPDSGTNTVVVYHIPTSHSNDMLIVHLPGHGIVFESDMWNPMPNPNPSLPQGGAFDPDNITELHNGIVARIINPGGTVTTLAGGHGVTGPFCDLQAAVGSGTCP